MRRIRSQRGQASAEYAGVVALVAAAFAVVVASGPPEHAAGDLGSAICDAAGMCGDPAAARLTSIALTARDERRLVDRYLAADLDRFLEYRDSPWRDRGLDWSTDRCSAPLVGSTGASFDFTEACLRHDFGYRNYDRLGAFDERRRTVDERFLDDMRLDCEPRGWWAEGRCRAWAAAFHRAVRIFGGLSH